MKYHWAALGRVEAKFPFNPTTTLVRELKRTYAYDLEKMINVDISTVHEVFVLLFRRCSGDRSSFTHLFSIPTGVNVCYVSP